VEQDASEQSQLDGGKRQREMQEGQRWRRSVKLPRAALSCVVFLSLGLPQCLRRAAAFHPCSVYFLCCLLSIGIEPGSRAVLTWNLFLFKVHIIITSSYGPTRLPTLVTNDVPSDWDFPCFQSLCFQGKSSNKIVPKLPKKHFFLLHKKTQFLLYLFFMYPCYGFGLLTWNGVHHLNPARHEATEPGNR
jgi:hypothetical protein